MNSEELSKIKKCLIQISESVNQYGNHRYVQQLRIIAGMIECIDSDENLDNKHKYLVEKYKMLFLAPGNLSDFYIHNDNFQIRLALNKPLDESR